MIARALELLGYVLAATAAIYAWIAVFAMVRSRWSARRSRLAMAGASRPVSVLKPLCGDEPGLYGNLRSFFEQSEIGFQLLFGVHEPNDPAIAVVRRLQAEFPLVDCRLVVDRRIHGTNLKVSNLINILPYAKHDWLVLADSDIKVKPDYLVRVAAPLADPAVGVVTCLYRGVPKRGLCSRLGAMFINDWFRPSVNVSHAFGSTRFSFGATMALRREALLSAGGFETLSNLLADDFWLGEFIRLQGLRTVLSDVVVSTDVVDADLPSLWSHEIRWLRTIRGAESFGFAFSFVTFTFPVAAAGFALTRTPAGLTLALAGLAARLLLRTAQSQDPNARFALLDLGMVPVRDCLSIGEWMVALTGSRVRWRNRILDAFAVETQAAAASRIKGLIVTADDFGLHESVNVAVELAHRDGILTTASLMVAAPAAPDAVRRAHRLKSLRVGLHLVLIDGFPCLPPSRIPDLVGADGQFRRDMVIQSIRLFLLPRVRRQFAQEIRAQFEAFAATGLHLDHVNAHKHFHFHPTILSLVIREGRSFGVRAVRLPAEAEAPLLMRPWQALLARRLEAAGLRHNDQVVGIRRSGSIDEAVLLEAVENLEPGVTEIYLHPATVSGSTISPSMPDYHHAGELAALRSARVAEAIRERGIPVGGFQDLVGGPLPTSGDGGKAANECDFAEEKTV